MARLIRFFQLKGSVKQPNIFHNYKSEKITRKASDAEYNKLFGSSAQACAKSHMLSASRRQPHLLHVSAVDRRQTWSMAKS